MMRFWLGVLGALGLAGCSSAGGSSGYVTEQSVIQPATIQFASNWSIGVSKALVASEPIAIDYDVARLPQCRGEQNGKPAWYITGYWRLNGGDPYAIDVAGHSPTGAPLVPGFTPPASGKLEMWFFNGNAWGCNAWDSSFGKNYQFTVEPPENAPGWVGNAVSVISRWTCDLAPCASDRKALESGFKFDTWARQRAVYAHLFFDVWKAGITDWDNPDLWKELDVRMHYRFGSSGEFASRYVDFDRRVGNDARYAAPLRKIDPFGGNTITDPANCPKVPLTKTADGQYVRSEIQLYFSINGVELRPASGGTFKGAFEDYVGLYQPCLP